MCPKQELKTNKFYIYNVNLKPISIVEKKSSFEGPGAAFEIIVIPTEMVHT